MSNPTNPSPAVISVAAPSEADPALEEKKPNIAVRAIRKIKTTPPKTAIAVAAGVALVAVGAALGRSTAPYSLEVTESPLELEPVIKLPDHEDSSDDTTVTD